MCRRLPVALVVLLLLAVACGGDASDAPAGETSVPDSGDTTTVPESTTTIGPTTTQTVPPEATELPDLQIIFVAFGDAGYVEIENRGGTDADVSGIQLCQFPTYVDLGSVVDGATIAAGESVQIPADVLGGLNIAGGEAALYSRPDFTDAEAIFAFVQWGTGGARSDVAAEAGIWPAGATVEPSAEFNSIELGGDPADPESWS